MKQIQSPRRQSQGGAILIIALVMLVLITLVSVATIRSATAEEKMAGNSRDRDKAFQAAEAAVQYCLLQLQNSTYTGTPLTPVVPPGAQNWEGTWDNSNSTEVSLDTTTTNGGLASQPRCMFEVFGTNGSYRVTGRAVGASSQSVVILQATYSVE